MKDFHYDEHHNFLWVNSVVGGTIPSNFLPAVEKGFKERMEKGVIAGHMVQDVAVEVHFGKHHDVDSSEAAFKIAGSMAFRNVFQQARPALLEPVVKMEITVPEANVGDVYSDMSSRGGRVQGSDSAGGGYQTVRCRSAAARSHDLRPHALQHDRRPGQLHRWSSPTTTSCPATCSRKSSARPAA